MALENVHPEVLKRVQDQLPQGSLITDAFTETEADSVFLVTYNGKERRTRMPKASTCEYLANRAVGIDAKEGDKLADLITVISENYRLYLVPGVDYVVPDEVVKFGCQGVIEYSFPVLSESISLHGMVSFKIKNKSVCDRPKERLQTDLSLQQIQLALVSKVFTAEGNVFVGSKLTPEFSKQLTEHLHSLEVDKDLTAENFSKGKVLDDYHDGVTRLTVVQTSNKKVVAIRYSAELQDKPVLNKPVVVEPDEQ